MESIPDQEDNLHSDNAESADNEIQSSHGSPNDRFTLIPQSKLASVLKILEQRLPKSANVYNTALRLTRYPDEFPMYILDGGCDVVISTNSWILTVHSDKGLVVSQMISISAPGHPRITDDIKQALTDTSAINWVGTYMFNAVDRALSPMLMEISSFINQNVASIYPNYYYTISKENALNLKLSTDDNDSDSSVKIKSLNDPDVDAAAAASFVTLGWTMASHNSTEYAASKIKSLPSSGVYVDGQLVSAALTHSDLNVGMLTTDPDHRGKGYGVLCLKAQLRNLAREGYFPSSCVYEKNTASNRVHIKCGMTVSHDCDYIRRVE